MGIIKDIDSEIINLFYFYYEHKEESVKNAILQTIIEKIPFGINPIYFIEHVNDSTVRLKLRNEIGDEMNYKKILYDFHHYKNDHKNLMKGSYMVSRFSDSIFITFEKYEKSYFNLVEEFISLFPDFENLDTETQFKKITEFLYCYKGFQGNSEDYYNPENSFITSVFESKKGIPVSLSVITLNFNHILTKTIESRSNKKLNYEIYGINLPGHFLLCFSSETFFTYFDPFNFGNIISYEECCKYLMKHGFSLNADIFRPTPTHLIIIRMLRNLINHYKNTNEEKKYKTIEKALEILNNLLQVEG